MHNVRLGTTLQPQSNIPCNCLRCLYCAATVGAPQRHYAHLDTTLPGTSPRLLAQSRPRRPKPTMLIDDTIEYHSIDTETLEHIVEYVAADGTVVMTQTVDQRTWSLHREPFARRRRTKY
jgi:hypothetical protein